MTFLIETSKTIHNKWNSDIVRMPRKFGSSSTLTLSSKKYKKKIIWMKKWRLDSAVLSQSKQAEFFTWSQIWFLGQYLTVECKLRQGGSESQKKSGFPEKEQKTSFLCGFLVTCQCKGRFYSKEMYPKILHTWK